MGEMTGPAELPVKIGYRSRMFGHIKLKPLPDCEEEEEDDDGGEKKEEDKYMFQMWWRLYDTVWTDHIEELNTTVNFDVEVSPEDQKEVVAAPPMEWEGKTALFRSEENPDHDVGYTINLPRIILPDYCVVREGVGRHWMFVAAGVLLFLIAAFLFFVSIADVLCVMPCLVLFALFVLAVVLGIAVHD
eukprot:NODE_2257_length_810_cov_250.141919_g1575_i0.p1 GENE.NODE_2257_length_810_cov_250.141919_g1575_i0~~NODE_2257_length_810_cov_250.141919_g1575_i0.p1  ORF type:complete len:197 (+),score=93.16 NODE_2257_length_810_cov_250.141919_g1575_i0:28-591(+)